MSGVFCRRGTSLQPMGQPLLKLLGVLHALGHPHDFFVSGGSTSHWLLSLRARLEALPLLAGGFDMRTLSLYVCSMHATSLSCST